MAITDEMKAFPLREQSEKTLEGSPCGAMVSAA